MLCACTGHVLRAQLHALAPHILQTAALEAQVDQLAAEGAALQQELRECKARAAELEAPLAKSGARCVGRQGWWCWVVGRGLPGGLSEQLWLGLAKSCPEGGEQPIPTRAARYARLP